ncbi:MAG: CBS domain-containing protein [Holophagales bacterium]|nr:CBS domain-containing protein [Holophagales bacterium]
MTEHTVRDLMSDRVVAVRPDDDLKTLHDLMLDHNVRHIPVVDRDSDLVGLVSHRDLLRTSLVEQPDLTDYMEEALLESSTVSAVMTEEVATVEPDTRLQEAAEVMFENKYGCLPVVEGRRLVGILTESDFVRLVAKAARVPQAEVG